MEKPFFQRQALDIRPLFIDIHKIQSLNFIGWNLSELYLNLQHVRRTEGFFWKAAISFVMSLCPPGRPHETTRLPGDGISWYLIFGYFSAIYRDDISFIKIWSEQRVLYMNTRVHLWLYLAQFFLEWEMFQINHTIVNTNTCTTSTSQVKIY